MRDPPKTTLSRLSDLSLNGFRSVKTHANVRDNRIPSTGEAEDSFDTMPTIDASSSRRMHSITSNQHAHGLSARI